MPAVRPAPTSPPARLRRRAGRRGVGAAVGGVLVAFGATTAVRVRRMRRAGPTPTLEHTATLGEGLGEPVRLLVLGDSAARGYGLADAGDAYPQQLARRLAAGTGRRVHVTALATDGHRTADVLDQQVPRVRAVRPDVVVVSVGVNDALGRTRAADLDVATHELLTRLRVAGQGALVALVTCPDLRDAPGLPRPLGVVVGWRCRRVAAVQERVARDLGVPTVPLPTVARAMFGADGLHPGEAGHAGMARETATVLLAHAAGLRTDTDRPGAPAWTSS